MWTRIAEFWDWSSLHRETFRIQRRAEQRRCGLFRASVRRSRRLATPRAFLAYCGQVSEDRVFSVLDGRRENEACDGIAVGQ